MLSILIPTYNHDAFTLAETLEKQALASNIVFEIICIDDGSFGPTNQQNQQINTLTNSKFIEARKNVGSIGNRKRLADNAQYEWFLFIDADMIPVRSDFINRFMSQINHQQDIIFGGIEYQNELPSADFSLRWHYGKQREVKSVESRLNRPYRSIISGCYMIRKNMFYASIKDVPDMTYGLDILLAFNYKKNKANVLHIDNTARHLGMEPNEQYLGKSRMGVETLHKLYKNKMISPSISKLLNTYHLLNTFGLAKITGGILKKRMDKYERKLCEPNPNLKYFDLYRLGHLCSL